MKPDPKGAELPSSRLRGHQKVHTPDVRVGDPLGRGASSCRAGK